MLTTGLFTTHQYEIKVDSVDDPILIIPVGDVHFGNDLHAAEKFDSFLDWAKGQPNAYFLFMGDLLEFHSTSEREVFRSRRLHESTLKELDKQYRALVDQFYDKVSFMDGRVIGMIEGNHYGELMNGTTTTQLLCDRLSCKYLGVCSFIRLAINYHGCKTVKDIFAHHGRGAARRLGGSLNRVEDMAKGVVADIFLMGHDHQQVSGKKPRLYLDKLMRVVERPGVFVRTGSFLRGYVDGEVSYVADAAYEPCALGAPYLTLHLWRRKVKGVPSEFGCEIMATL